MTRQATAHRPGRCAAAAGRPRMPSPSARSTTNRIRPPTTFRARPRNRRAQSRQSARSRQRFRLAHSAASFSEAVFEEDLNRAEAVAPADLLALRAAARLEANRQLMDRMPGAQQLRRNLRLDVEAVRFEIE